MLSRQFGNRPLTPEASAGIGRRLYTAIVLLESVLVVLFVPLLTIGTINGERQRRTFDDLLLTRLTGREIALGKLINAVAFFLVILLCSLPVLALTFLFGGVSPDDITLVVDGTVLLDHHPLCQHLVAIGKRGRANPKAIRRHGKRTMGSMR